MFHLRLMAIRAYGKVLCGIKTARAMNTIALSLDHLRAISIMTENNYFARDNYQLT